MCIFDKEFAKRKKQKKQTRKNKTAQPYQPPKGILCGSNDKFVMLKGYRKL
jgi:hypothetical protein